MASEYENIRRVIYDGGACFIPVCHCGRFVTADDNVMFNGFGELSHNTNGTCEKHGRINMIFEGFVDD